MTETLTFESQSLDDWLFYLQSQHTKEIDLGLERVQNIAAKLNILELNAGKVVLVAGTNGKGTTIRFMEQYLLSLGLSVGVYGSPHIFHYNERVRINGQVLPDETHIDAFSYVERGREGSNLTYFEFGTLAAYKILKDAQLDVILVEVGLGGRLDATNILEHDLAVVTSIGLDHTDWLGSTLEQIGFEKAGIFKSGKPAVVGHNSPPKSIYQQQELLKPSQLLVAGTDYQYQVDEAGNSWSYSSQNLCFSDLYLPLIPIQNIATAITALATLSVNLSPNLISDTIRNLSLTGRVQILSRQPFTMVDVAHNAHAVSYLSKLLDQHEEFAGVKQLQVVVAMMHDKDICETLSVIKDKVSHWHIADLKANPRAASAAELEAILRDLNQQNIKTYASISDAWQQATENLPDDSLLLGFGSFYTVAEILELTL